MTRIQAQLIFEFGLYAAGRRDFSASIRDRLVFATGFYTQHYGIHITASRAHPDGNDALINNLAKDAFIDCHAQCIPTASRNITSSKGCFQDGHNMYNIQKGSSINTNIL